MRIHYTESAGRGQFKTGKRTKETGAGAFSDAGYINLSAGSDITAVPYPSFRMNP